MERKIKAEELKRKVQAIEIELQRLQTENQRIKELLNIEEDDESE
jgi:hypothetical protein